MEDLNQTFSEKFTPKANSTPKAPIFIAKTTEKRNFRTSTPLPGLKKPRGRCLIKNAYDDWKRYLDNCERSSNFKVRGMRNPPAHFISGNKVFATSSPIEFPPKDKQGNRMTVAEYVEKIEERNKNICDKLFPMLLKGLQKLNFTFGKKIGEANSQTADDSWTLKSIKCVP